MQGTQYYLCLEKMDLHINSTCSDAPPCILRCMLMCLPHSVRFCYPALLWSALDL